jgi:hypothetical protein
MLSTIEALLYAAWEVEPRRFDFVKLLYLFAIQRAEIAASCIAKGEPLPWTAEEKEKQAKIRYEGSLRAKDNNMTTSAEMKKTKKKRRNEKKEKKKEEEELSSHRSSSSAS